MAGWDELATPMRLWRHGLRPSRAHAARAHGGRTEAATRCAVAAKAPKRRLCARCGRPPRVCICSSVPRTPVDAGLRVIVLQHPSEAARPQVSSVPLLSMCVSGVHVCVGTDWSEGVFPVLDEALGASGTVLLYPGKGSVAVRTLAAATASQDAADGSGDGHGAGSDGSGRLSTALASTWKTVIAVDGTWRHAKSMLAGNPRVAAAMVENGGVVTRAHVDTGRPQAFVFRKEPFDFCVSTAEAVAEAIKSLAPRRGDDAHAAILRAFDEMVRLQSAHVPRIRSGAANAGTGGDTPGSPSVTAVSLEAVARDAVDEAKRTVLTARPGAPTRDDASGAAASGGADAAGGSERSLAWVREYEFCREQRTVEGSVVQREPGVPTVECTYSQALFVRDRLNIAIAGSTAAGLAHTGSDRKHGGRETGGAGRLFVRPVGKAPA